MYTSLNVADNSGAKTVQCIKVLGGSRRGVRRPRATSSSSRSRTPCPNAPVKKGTVERAVIVRTKKEYRRADGTYIRFDDNACVIIDAGRTQRASASSGRWPASCARGTT